MAIDIDSRKEGVAGKLSNLTERHFFFYGVPCRSLEGVLQAFKFFDPVVQRSICMIPGREAQKKGQVMNSAWKSQQVLWWQGRKYPRESTDYQRLLNDLFSAAFALPDFQKDLLEPGNEELIHTIGKDDPTDTVLTAYELCSRLMDERARLRREKRMLTISDMNHAAKMIEVDGDEAFNAVSDLYGDQVAKLLLITHIRRREGSMNQYPPDLSIDKLVFETFKRL